MNKREFCIQFILNRANSVNDPYFNSSLIIAQASEAWDAINKIPFGNGINSHSKNANATHFLLRKSTRDENVNFCDTPGNATTIISQVTCTKCKSLIEKMEEFNGRR